MLLLHQAGSVKIGEVVRYTVTYTPAYDRILPSPPHLHLKIKNTSAIALRAAFVHGPYTLYASACPSTFSPNSKFENPRRDGIPEFEPNLKAGGVFTTRLCVPEEVRKSAGSATRSTVSGEDVRSVSWIIEVASQVIFSNSAAVHYEIFLGRDEKALTIGFGSGMGLAPTPGQVSDHQQSIGAKNGHHNSQQKGVYSRSIRLRVDDTASLWNTPKMPEWDNGNEGFEGKDAPVESLTEEKDSDQGYRQKRQKKVHLVVLTHGLHSNLGADMLYLKESIDATAKQAKVDAKKRMTKEREEGNMGESSNDEQEQEVIVRGFSGNAVRTERGIKYLGKRLAKYVLNMTYPDQPYRPVTKKSAADALSHALKPEVPKIEEKGTPTHENSTIFKEPYHDKKLAYKITSISFIAHSLGGLIQTYAVAYIQKHSPTFFDVIQPINFIALATPFLGLSNENPLYVKFALDFGLVGRTGQDLGLTWRPPTIARSGWGAIVGGISENAHKKLEGEGSPESKPLLRILPTGPAHTVLKKFRNRTVYSNVVNDGIVPLRTSCLLFLDWQGLGRVEKARRENGLVGTMAGWGWAELTGANSSSPSRSPWSQEDVNDSEDTVNTPTRQGHGEEVPQPPSGVTDDDDTRSLKSIADRPHSAISSPGADPGVSTSNSVSSNNTGALAGILGFFKSSQSPKSHNHEPKSNKIYKRSQTIKSDNSTQKPADVETERGRSKATTGESDAEDSNRLSAPPKTTFFESAGDLLKPPLPSVEFLIDPSSRPRTIFHDRVYHPEDIPSPPLKKRPSALRRRSTSLTTSSNLSVPPTPSTLGIPHAGSNLSSRDYDDTKHTNPDKDPRDVVDGSAMKVEEKIARAYHRDLSWRKVLVRLEPDAHNNMIVRRMFANAYGWPVIHHLCETHFSDSRAAREKDEDESNTERAKKEDEKPDEAGGEVNEIDDGKDKGKAKERERGVLTLLTESPERTNSEIREQDDEVPSLHEKEISRSRMGSSGKALHKEAADRASDENSWSESQWMDSADDSDLEGSNDEKGKGGGGWTWTEAIVGRSASSPRGTEKQDLEGFLGKHVSRTRDGADSPEELDPQFESDAAAARMLSGEMAGMGLGLDLGLAHAHSHSYRDEEDRKDK
ncbi:Acylglycerol lipase/Carboxylesterase [Chlorociboria aeruginascens]|nr:Acylglycerol lipase/Carboxylesterase [Chlorociboria aeruginascens]